MSEKSMFVVLMGVAGSGKTTVGRMLADELGWQFYDADDFHPPVNVAKMARGVPLDDADRQPWLQALRALIHACLERGESAVLACSALKANYRDYLLLDERVKLAYLKGDLKLIRQRLENRSGHFMRTEMLESQFATLEEPEPESHFDIDKTPAEIVRAIRLRLGL